MDANLKTLLESQAKAQGDLNAITKEVNVRKKQESIKVGNTLLSDINAWFKEIFSGRVFDKWMRVEATFSELEDLDPNWLSLFTKSVKGLTPSELQMAMLDQTLSQNKDYFDALHFATNPRIRQLYKTKEAKKK